MDFVYNYRLCIEFLGPLRVNHETTTLIIPIGV